MLFSDPLKRNKLLFWLAIGCIAAGTWELYDIVRSMELVEHFGLILYLFFFDNLPYYIQFIGFIGAGVLFLLCTLDETATHLKPTLYIIGTIAYSAPFLANALVRIDGIFMGMYTFGGIIKIALTALYTIVLVIITVFLFTRKYQPWLFTAFCASAGAWFAFGIVLGIMGFASNPNLLELLWQLFYILFDALPIIFIAITLWTGCYFPPEMRLRQLMSMHSAGKLDDASYQERRAEVIRNL